MIGATQEDLAILKQTAEDFFADHFKPGQIRDCHNAATPLCFDPKIWSKMGEMGWPAICIPSAYEGAAMGFGAQCAIIEAMGSCLAPEPVATNVLCIQAFLLSESAEAARWVPRMGRAEIRMALAHREHLVPFWRTKSMLTRCTDGYITGSKAWVDDGVGADFFLVSAKDDGLPCLFLVDALGSGVEIVPQARIDHSNVAQVHFHNAPVVSLLGGAPLLETLFDRAALLTSAELLGIAQRAFDMTVERLKTRGQVEIPLGSLQSVEQSALRLYMELELTRSTVYAAAAHVDGSPRDTALLTSLAKAYASQTAQRVTNEVIQMHETMGVTDEDHIGLYLKRARVGCTAWGGASFHRQRWAELRAY